MKLRDLHIGQEVKHPHYGFGRVKTLGAQGAEILFNDSTRWVDPEASALESAEPVIEVTGVHGPLRPLVAQIVEETVAALGVEMPDARPIALSSRWKGGSLVLAPADTALQSKEWPLETFFHKIVMMRNNLRVLEQKVNAHAVLTDAEKVEMQQYITKCYGSMTSFNLLFSEKEEQFGG